MGVDESPAFLEKRIRKEQSNLFEVVGRNWRIALYAIILMTAFNFFSHGSQDAYANLFLKVQHRFDTHAAATMTAIINIGAILGGILFGFLSESIGRPRAVFLAAFLTLPVIPFFAFG